MYKSCRSAARLAVAGLSLFFASSVLAAPILVGQAIPTPNEPFGGVPVGAPVISPFNTPPGPGAFSGTLFSQAFTGDPFNPYGGLTFVYQVHNDATSNTAIERLTDVDFAPFQTDVSYDGAGVSPTSSSRISASVIGWNFPLGIVPGATSSFLIVQTDAVAPILSMSSLIDGQVVSTASLGPDISVILPEPASMAVIAGLGIALFRRR